MLRLSLRAGNSTWRFGPAQWGYVDGSDLTATQAAVQLAGKRVVVLVHGYRVEDPVDAYWRVWSHIQSFYDIGVFGFWPGSSFGLGFWMARMRAAKAGRLLAEALGSLAPSSMDLEGHSLGCMVSLEALSSGLRCRNLLLAAPAVDNESIQAGEKYGNAVMRASRVLVGYSRHDSVLAGAYRLGCLDGALGWKGPQDSKRCAAHITAVDCATADGHSAYKRDNTFFGAWGALISP